MNLQEIKKAVNEGKKVHWSNTSYEVKKEGDEYLVICSLNNSCIGLTWKDGKTLNENEEDFFIGS